MVETAKRKHKLEDEFGNLDANKALEIYERLSKTCMSQPKENKPLAEKPSTTSCLTIKNQGPTQK